ncbi:hypothetical protein FKP32DRAFT_264780 [Trametes sanguinea]|nr:hypothetical protein FKP32DRAFT_264780 [Trametes sanguinea]
MFSTIDAQRLMSWMHVSCERWRCLRTIQRRIWWCLAAAAIALRHTVRQYRRSHELCVCATMSQQWNDCRVRLCKVRRVSCHITLLSLAGTRIEKITLTDRWKRMITEKMIMQGDLNTIVREQSDTPILIPCSVVQSASGCTPARHYGY